MQSILDTQAVETYLLSLGEKKYRAGQVQQAVFKDLMESIDEITTLPEALREKLKEDFFLSSLTATKVQQSAKDATMKVLFKTGGAKELFIESVLMRHLTGRITLCISSQVGCPLACKFCATGKLGFFRNLQWYEILDQILYFERELKKEGQSIRNIVFMGMGEPMINYANVIQAVRVMNDPKKLGIGARHITISTSGIVPGIEKLIAENIQVKLAISLHAPNDELRTRIMPINKPFPLAKLMAAIDKYEKLTNKRIFYEYVMLRDVNDTAEHAHQLGKLLQGRLAHVNLIPWNAIDASDFQRSETETMKNFQKILEEYEIPSTIRATLGDDIAAACGQLANKERTKVAVETIQY